MIILFMVSFGAWLIMLFMGFTRSAVVHSGIPDQFSSSRYARKARKARLRKHWLITWLLFAIAIYAGLNLY